VQRKLALVVAFLFPAVALAQNTAPASGFRDLGVLSCANGIAMSATTDCEVRDLTDSNLGKVTNVRGYNTLTLEIRYEDNAGGAGTGYTFVLQSCDEGDTSSDCTDAADWHAVAVEQAAASTITITPATVTRSSDADDRISWSIGLNYQRLRLGSITGTGSPGATDLLYVRARLGRVP